MIVVMMTLMAKVITDWYGQWFEKEHKLMTLVA